MVAAARDRPCHTVEFWGGYAGWSGGDAEDFTDGPATGATFLFHVGLPVQIGVDLGFARLETGQIFEQVYEFSASFAARYRIMGIRRVRPFLGMRAGYTRLSADFSIFRFEQNGSLVGGSAGFEIPAGARVMLILTGEAMYQNYRDAMIFLYDIDIPSSGGNAWRWWSRLGLAFRW